MELLIWAFLLEERARARIDKSVAINALYGTRSVIMSLKKCVFDCEGKITLFSFPKNPALRKQWMQFVFPGQQRSFSSVFVDERFINKAQFDAGFAHRLILKDGAVPAIKSRSWFRTADGKWNGIKCLCFAHRRSFTFLPGGAPTGRPWALMVFFFTHRIYHIFYIFNYL